MFTDLNVFRTANALANHASQRQTIIAQNVANADTPGYKARDIAPFGKILSTGNTTDGIRAGRDPFRRKAPDPGAIWDIVTPNLAADPNGNTVSIEREMLNGVDVKRQFDLAIAVYKSSLNILRASLGRA